ncbi:unnamed protein product [Rhizoctonia solani]|uniref:Uncharacterized protein n=1 Tax=Rhizoctonia solani TaxID=456999 RepID=A0A8H3AD98_9AGAM|nr:unnamed protein product [Rhizoctonia solani]
MLLCWISFIALFQYHQSHEMHLTELFRCVSILLFYIYGTMVAMLIASSASVTRIWAIYERRQVTNICYSVKSLVVLRLNLALSPIASLLCILAAGICVPSMVTLQWQARQCKLVPNPAPDLISGCRFNSTPLAILPYIAPFLYDTTLFIMTVHRVWKTSNTPLMARLLSDGSQYYVIVMGTFLLVGFSSLVPPIRDGINGSGLFVAVLSSMCTRLAISTRSYYDEALYMRHSLEMTTVTGDLRFHTDEWRVPESVVSISEGLGLSNQLEQKA